MLTTVTRRSTVFSPLIIACLVTVYIVWGSTYVAIAYTLETMPPLLMTGTRFLAAGLFLICVLLIRGLTWPTPKQMLNCAIVGGSMLGLGVGGIGVAEQSISSGLASVGIATVPIWAVLLAGLWMQQWPNRWEVVGILLGFVGVFLLNLQNGFGAQGLGAVIIVLAALFWAIGSVLSRFIDLPKGATAYAFEMTLGGAFITVIGLLTGERFTQLPSAISFFAWLYLVIGGSLFAYSAYMYLLQNIRTSVATSYALATPVVAILLGVHLLGETLDIFAFAAMASVILGVWFIFKGRDVRDSQSP